MLDTLKGSNRQFFNFSAQSQTFTGGLTGPKLPQFSDKVKNQCQEKRLINTSFKR